MNHGPEPVTDVKIQKLNDSINTAAEELEFAINGAHLRVFTLTWDQLGSREQPLNVKTTTAITNLRIASGLQRQSNQKTDQLLFLLIPHGGALMQQMLLANLGLITLPFTSE